VGSHRVHADVIGGSSKSEAPNPKQIQNPKLE
jgi:hypothetical protein